jgi:hypothetical protein
MSKIIAALVLGIVSFFLMFLIGEEVSVGAGYGFVGVYYLICQFILSRDSSRPLVEQWLVILALNAALIVTSILVLLIEPDTKYHALVAVVSLLASVLGATAAGWRTRRSYSGTPPQAR